MLEGQMDDAIGRGRRGGEPVRIVERAAVHLRAGGFQGARGGVRPGQSGDLMARLEQLADDDGSDVPAGAGDEYAHDFNSSSDVSE